MALAVRQLHKHFFGEVSGLDLRVPLTKEQAAEVEAAMDKYAVLVFHGQDLTDEQQLAFALNFGEREKARGGTVVKKEDYRLTSGLNDVSNLGKEASRSRATAAPRCSTSAIGFGIPTARSGRSPQNSRCCRRGW